MFFPLSILHLLFLLLRSCIFFFTQLIKSFHLRINNVMFIISSIIKAMVPFEYFSHKYNFLFKLVLFLG